MKIRGLMLACAMVATAGSAPRPNIVLFVADDLGTTIGCYGDPVARTPNMDRLAAAGVRFTYAFCTTASCSPSRSAILSGRHNHASGQYGLEHAEHHFRSFEKIRTLPVILEEEGYRTARIGKFHVAPEPTYRFQTALRGNARNGVQMAENCAEWLRAESESPFFLYFCTSDPHRGGGKGGVGETDPFGNGTDYPGVQEIAFDPAQVPVPPWLPDSPQARAELAEYYQSVSRVDQGLGRLLEVLEEAGRLENTLVLLLSDNGIAFPGAKTTLYEPGMRLPLIISGPGLGEGGRVSEAMISWVDLAPTLLELAGVQPPQEMQGRSFLPVLKAGESESWDRVFASHTFHEVTMYYPMRVVRERQWKLIHNVAWQLPFPHAQDLWSSATWQDVLRRNLSSFGPRPLELYLQRPEWELYDLANDPQELQNLAGDPAAAATLRRLQGELRDFQRRTHDPWQIKHTHQ